MALIGLQDIHYTIGGLQLFAGASIQIETGDRLCLVGRNGAGKSTLIALMRGTIPVDKGEISRQQGLRMAALDQELPEAPGETALAAALAAFPVSAEPWEQERKARQYLSKLGVEPETDFGTLSGGNKRRAALAGALACEPDLLLLDEPTNHLDIETIAWLEDALVVFRGAVVFVTHDRQFARRVATRVAEVDRGRLIAFACGWDAFLERRESVLEAEDKRWAEFEKKLAAEEVWVRRGVKARLKRNEGRVKALLKMRQEMDDRRHKTGAARMTLQEADRSGDLVFETRHLGFTYPGRQILRDFTRTVMRRERIGIIGRNGTGKTTLLRLLFGDLHPSHGHLHRGTNLQVLYFDQLRSQLDLTKSVQDNVGGGYDTVEIGGKHQHILGYLDRFLFSAERARASASILSGGERNRLMLAKLFTRPSNVLVLDEPTNDLDAETLDLLEELLLEYRGTIFLVSHDREFLDNVVTSTWSFNDDGTLDETPGGWTEWAAWMQRKKVAAADAAKLAKTALNEGGTSADGTPPKPKKRSFKEERELEALPAKIEALDAEKNKLHADLADPAFYKTSGSSLTVVTARLEAIEAELTALYARWEKLEG